MATAFNINSFKAQLTDGGARANQFSVQLEFPSFVAGAAQAGRASEFLVDAAELPGQTIGITPVYYRGREVKLVGERQFQPFTFTVLNDSGFIIRKAFESWMNALNSRETNAGLLNTTGPAAYSRSVIITQLDRNGKELIKYTLLEAWPSDVGAVALGFDQNDRISTFQVALQYQTFQIDGI